MKQKRKAKLKKISQNIKTNEKQFFLGEVEQAQKAKIDLQKQSTPLIWQTLKEKMKCKKYDDSCQQGWGESSNFVTQVPKMNKKNFKTEIIDFQNSIKERKPNLSSNFKSRGSTEERCFKINKKFRQRQTYSNNIITLKTEEANSSVNNFNITTYRNNQKMNSCILHSSFQYLYKKKQAKKQGERNELLEKQFKLQIRSSSKKRKKQIKNLKIISGITCRPLKGKGFRSPTERTEKTEENQSSGRKAFLVLKNIQKLKNEIDREKMSFRVLSSPLQIVKL